MFGGGPAGSPPCRVSHEDFKIVGLSARSTFFILIFSHQPDLFMSFMLPVERYKRACHHGQETPSILSAEDDNDENTSRGRELFHEATYHWFVFAQIAAAMFVI